MVPSSTIRQRMDQKDLRFEREARRLAELRSSTPAIYTDSPIVPPLVYQPLTHEERQELIRRPITFHTYGSKGWGGMTINQPQIFGDGSRGSTSPDDDSDNR